MSILLLVLAGHIFRIVFLHPIHLPVFENPNRLQNVQLTSLQRELHKSVAKLSKVL